MSRWDSGQDIVTGGVSVKDYGAKGDGTTNDQPAFQAAADSGKKFITIPHGNYFFADGTGVTFPAQAQQSWVGMGAGSWGGVTISVKNAYAFSATYNNYCDSMKLENIEVALRAGSVSGGAVDATSRVVSSGIYHAGWVLDTVHCTGVTTNLTPLFRCEGWINGAMVRCGAVTNGGDGYAVTTSEFQSNIYLFDNCHVASVAAATGATEVRRSKFGIANGAASDPTGGTFRFDYEYEYTPTIAYNATAATVTTALEATVGLKPGDVSVVKNGQGDYTITFTGDQAARPQYPMVIDPGALTGPNSPYTTTTTQVTKGTAYAGFRMYGLQGHMRDCSIDPLGGFGVYASGDIMKVSATYFEGTKLDSIYFEGGYKPIAEGCYFTGFYSTSPTDVRYIHVGYGTGFARVVDNYMLVSTIPTGWDGYKVELSLAGGALVEGNFGIGIDEPGTGYVNTILYATARNPIFAWNTQNGDNGAADVLKAKTWPIRVQNIGVNNSVAATEVIGKAVVKKIQVYDGDGTSIGYIPVYTSIT